MGDSQRVAERPSAPREAWGIGNGSAELTVEQILVWADAHHAATGLWPISSPSAVAGAPGHTWEQIDQALRHGHCGRNRKTSLARLLARHRGLGNPSAVVRLTVEEILAWADAHHAATGDWPVDGSGPVPGAPCELTWSAINQALKLSRYGLRGGTSLARLLTEHLSGRPLLTVERILAWADAYHAAHGLWPCNEYKPGAAAPGETWKAIDQALKVGWRGLPGGTSLARLLVEHRGPEAGRRHPRLTVAQILAWADAYHAATGRWPVNSPCAVAEAPGVTWEKIEQALRRGRCGLTRKTSLACLLAQHRRVRNQGNVPSSMVDQILAWADAHHAATGRWPSRYSGPVRGAPGQRWHEINETLYRLGRGLPGRLTLEKLLAQHRGATGSRKVL